MKNKAEKSSKVYKKKSVFKIKKAISRFISNTQKIVQKVKPEAQIIIPKKKAYQKKLKNQASATEKSEAQSNSDNTMRLIYIPDYNGKL